MTVDIVGTTLQPHYALLAFLSGVVVGVLGLCVYFLFGKKSKVGLFISDLICTLILGFSGLLFCVWFLKGVFYFYVFFCETIGYAISFFLLKKTVSKLLSFLKNKTKSCD